MSVSLPILEERKTFRIDNHALSMHASCPAKYELAIEQHWRPRVRHPCGPFPSQQRESRLVCIWRHHGYYDINRSGNRIAANRGDKFGDA